MRDTVRYFAYLVLGRAPELEGVWQRVGDNFADCRIAVERAEQGLQGRITHIPASMRKLGWKVGDVKWTQIARRKRTVYSLQDMYKQYDMHRQELTAIAYGSSWLRFVADHELIVVPQSAAQGSRTRWKRTGTGKTIKR